MCCPALLPHTRCSKDKHMQGRKESSLVRLAFTAEVYVESHGAQLQFTTLIDRRLFLRD